MKINNKLLRIKQRRIRVFGAKSNSYDFFNLLTSPELFAEVEELLPDNHRERQFPPTETLSMFLAQAINEDRSCQKAVNDAAIKRVISGLSPCSTRTGGYCQARNRLSTEMVSSLVRGSKAGPDLVKTLYCRVIYLEIRLILTLNLPFYRPNRTFKHAYSIKRQIPFS